MNEKKELKFLLTTNEKITSTNSLYNAGIKYIGGKPKPYIYKSQKAQKFTQEVIEQLRAVNFSEYIEWIKCIKQFDITISFILKSNVTRRDVQNLDKLLIDIITKYIKEDLGVEKFDDSLFTSVHFYKSIIPKSKHEYACIKITESKSNLRFDQIDTPDKFYIGPELDEFKKEIKKEFKERKLKIIDKLENKDQCNSLLYILTPNTKNQILEVANIINVVWECLTSELGFVFIGVKDKEGWPDDLKTQLEDMIRLVKSISGSSSRIKIGYINEIKDIFDL